MITIMNHERIAEISAEMTKLLDQQRKMITDTAGAYTKQLTAAEIHEYFERNTRLRELAMELNKL